MCTEPRINARDVASALVSIGDAFHRLAKAVEPQPTSHLADVAGGKSVSRRSSALRDPGEETELAKNKETRAVPITAHALQASFAVLASRPGGKIAAMEVLSKFKLPRISMAKPEQFAALGAAINAALRKLPEPQKRGRRSRSQGTTASDDPEEDPCVSLPETRVSIWKLFSDLCGTEEGKARAREILREFGIVRIEDAGEHQLDPIGEALRAEQRH